MSDLYNSLVEIVGEEHVSTQKEELYFYARDPGLMPAHEPDCVVTPETTEEVQKIVKLANREKIPIVPMGAGMALTGLIIPLKGGIVIDMKRMRKIANVTIHGQGRLAQQYGFNSDMVSGLEVVLPTGEICKIGSCSMSPAWFSKGPALPDLSGLFLGWLGTTGIITKLGLKLYPKKKMRDLEIFVTDREDLIPEILFRLTHTEMVEDINIWFQAKPILFKGNHHVTLYITGDTDEELELKRKMVWDSVKEFRESKDGGFMWVLPAMKPTFLDMPQKSLTTFADVKKGGGFEYSGPIVLIEKYPVLARKLEALADQYKLAYSGMARVIGRSHAMMFGIAFTFNRADSEMMDRVKKALHEGIAFAFDHGGIPWKPTVEEQKMAMKRMDPNTLKLMKMIKENLDPNGIMNPGNWEVN